MILIGASCEPAPRYQTKHTIDIGPLADTVSTRLDYRVLGEHLLLLFLFDIPKNYLRKWQAILRMFSLHFIQAKHNSRIFPYTRLAACAHIVRKGFPPHTTRLLQTLWMKQNKKNHTLSFTRKFFSNSFFFFLSVEIEAFLLTSFKASKSAPRGWIGLGRVVGWPDNFARVEPVSIYMGCPDLRGQLLYWQALRPEAGLCSPP